MSRTGRVFAILGAIITVSLIAVALVNMWDGEIQPDALALMSRSLDQDVPLSAKQATMYMLGWRASAEKDPLAVGSAIYDSLSKTSSAEPYDPIDLSKFDSPEHLLLPSSETLICRPFCSREAYRENEKQIEALLNDHLVLLTRYETWLSYGSFGNDWNPHVAHTVTGILELHTLIQLKMQEVNKEFYEKKFSKVLDDLTALFLFLDESLKYRRPVVSSSMIIATQGSIRAFLTDAISENGGLLGVWAKEKFKAFESKRDFLTLSERAAEYEFLASLGSLSLATEPRIFELSGLGSQDVRVEKRILAQVLSWLMVPLFNRTDTINSLFEATAGTFKERCWRKPESCRKQLIEPVPFYKKAYNPVGRGIVKIFAFHPVHVAEMHQRFSQIKASLNFGE